MKIKQLIGDRFKERPADCVIDSHVLMLRGGYMKYVASGIYSQYPPLRRITRKIEQIIREEMDALDGQEVQFPVALPAALWQESGRYDTIGSELLRFSDRNGAPLVLGMTHEEAAVQLVREYGQSYAKYPFFLYQIQEKFRDEARPRGGLIRVREFSMKDAYSFHTSQEDLEAFYQRCLQAYERIFARAGIPEVISVASDSGMMGGSLSHEFMLLTPVGEDSIALCGECGYRANLEAAECIVENRRDEQSQPLTLTGTPGAHTIEEVCQLLHLPREKACKAVAYEKETDGGLVLLFLRGDLEVNETKVTNFLGCGIRPASLTEESGLHPGFLGPCGLPCSSTAPLRTPTTSAAEPTGRDSIIRAWTSGGSWGSCAMRILQNCRTKESAPAAAGDPFPSPGESRWETSSSWAPSIPKPWACGTWTGKAISISP